MAHFGLALLLLSVCYRLSCELKIPSSAESSCFESSPLPRPTVKCFWKMREQLSGDDILACLPQDQLQSCPALLKQQVCRVVRGRLGSAGLSEGQGEMCASGAPGAQWQRAEDREGDAQKLNNLCEPRAQVKQPHASSAGHGCHRSAQGSSCCNHSPPGCVEEVIALQIPLGPRWCDSGSGTKAVLLLCSLRGTLSLCCSPGRTQTSTELQCLSQGQHFPPCYLCPYFPSALLLPLFSTHLFSIICFFLLN